MIIFTNHAERKLKQRNLKKEWIKKTLKDPDYSYDSHSNRKIAYKKIKRLYLAVVFVKEKKNLVVLTAHWEKEFDPKKKGKK